MSLGHPQLTMSEFERERVDVEAPGDGDVISSGPLKGWTLDTNLEIANPTMHLTVSAPWAEA